VKEGWSFDPSSRFYSSVTADQTNETYQAARITYTISGNVGLAGVMMDGLPSRPVTEADGSFSAEVPYKWSGTVTPRRVGYTFEPNTRTYEEVLSSRMSQDFQASVVQLTVSGTVRSETGPVPDVTITAEPDGGVATTDADGQFQLAVDYGWRGRITPTRGGYTFNPANRALEAVTRDVSNVGFIGRVRMMTITDSIVFGTEPIQGVAITAEPGGTTAVTDSRGRYTIQVPYGWTGDLIPEKEGFEFNPPNMPYSNVTENIDKTAPAPRTTPPARTPAETRPPTRTPAEVTAPAQTPVERPPSMPTTSEAVTDPEKAALLAERERLLKEIEALRMLGEMPDAEMELEDVLPPAQSRPTPRPGPLVEPTATGYTVLDVLTRISERTGVKIAVDATVKPDPVSIGFDTSMLTPAQVPLALQRTLDQTRYQFKAVADTYLVYLPITNTFQGDDLRNVLQDIALTAGVTIVPDPNVYGEVFAELKQVDLDTALRTILAGSPFVVQKTPDYYLVADRSVGSDAFPEISETHNVFLNYRNPQRVVELLSTAFSSYVRVSNDPNNRIVSVTAPPDMARRIVNEVRRLDLKPRHVLLDARVVVMERNDLLNVGVEWGWPQISMGTFSTSFDTGTGGSWPWGIQMGYTPDQTFTDSLLMALNLLQQNGQADVVSNPQVLAQDGRLSELGVITEEYFILTPKDASSAMFYMQAEMVTIESGTKLSITPRIGDNNDITLEMATEVSDSVPKGAGSDLPVVTRRTARNVVTVKDGGTVALAGLTENRSRRTDKRVPGLSNLPLLGELFKNTDNSQTSREIAVFVTAHLVPDGTTVRASSRQMPSQALGAGAQVPASTSANFDDDLRQSIVRLPR
jgi:type II secretory pathway component GspD/PulD (secretin)